MTSVGARLGCLPVVVIAAALSACSGPPDTNRDLQGRVWDGEGLIVPNATVQAKDRAGRYSIASQTGEDGSFHISLAVTEPPSGGTEVLISKIGFENTYGWVPGTDDAEPSLLIRRILILSPGEAMSLT